MASLNKCLPIAVIDYTTAIIADASSFITVATTCITPDDMIDPLRNLEVAALIAPFPKQVFYFLFSSQLVHLPFHLLRGYLS